MGISFHDVEVRAWPERGDLLVLDSLDSEILAQYIPMSRIESEITDLTLPFAKRAARALRSLENDQDLLQNYYLTEDAVCLRLDSKAREEIAGIFERYGLAFSDSDFLALRKTEDKLCDLSLDELFCFLLDWHDLVEKRQEAGSSLSDISSWVHRAAPDTCRHFTLLAGSRENAYEVFSLLVDVPQKDFSFGLFLRWVYFSRSEFSAFPRKTLQALG